MKMNMKMMATEPRAKAIGMPLNRRTKVAAT